MTDIEQRVAAALYSLIWGDYRPEDWPSNLEDQAEEWFDPPLVVSRDLLAALAADGLTIVTVDDAKLAKECWDLDYYCLIRDVFEYAGVER